MQNITIVGAGYVGMSLSVLLARQNKITILDIDKDRINKINQNIPTIQDDGIEEYYKKHNIKVKATLQKEEAYSKADFIIICTPTDYDLSTHSFDVKSVESSIADAIHFNKKANIVIKSTIPVGFTQELQQKYQTKKIFFSPEFLREGMALQDNLFPSRIIIGSHQDEAIKFSNLLKKAAEKKDIPVLLMDSNEAESVKLFSNTFLAMRVAFFNELDSFSMIRGMDTKSIIQGVCLDDRIGDFYNNPSFGYGGYCLPKDTQQLLSNYNQVPQNLIQAIVDANSTRKDFIADQLLKKNPKVIGIFKLAMKVGSDNFRFSSIQGVMKRVKSKGVEVIVFEPSLQESEFFRSKVIKSLEEFKNLSDIIVTNRFQEDLIDVKEKVFTRDIFSSD